MKKNITFSYILGILIILIINSCSNEVLDNSNNVMQYNKIQTKAVTLDPPLDYLNDLQGIPINIYSPPGASGVGKKYLSANNKDNNLLASDQDSGSGQERWILHNLSSNNENRFSIKPQTGKFHYISAWQDPNDKEEIYLYMQNDEYPAYDNEFTGWRFIPVDNKFLIESATSPKRWLTVWYGFYWVNYVLPPTPINNIECRFDIEPINEFILNDIEYKSLNNSDQIIGENYPIVSYPLENYTDIPMTQTIQSVANYSEKSTFYEMEGRSSTSTLKIDANFSINVPKIIKILNFSGTVSYTKSSTDSYQVTTGREESKSYTLTRTISMEVPPHYNLYIVTTSKKFKPKAKYVGHFYSSELGKTIRMSGNWEGEQFYELKVQAFDNAGKLLGNFNENGTFIPTNTIEKMDIEAIKQSIAKK